jgi:hypothetical protein
MGQAVDLSLEPGASADEEVGLAVDVTPSQSFQVDEETILGEMVLSKDIGTAPFEVDDGEVVVGAVAAAFAWGDDLAGSGGPRP